MLDKVQKPEEEVKKTDEIKIIKENRQISKKDFIQQLHKILQTKSAADALLLYNTIPESLKNDFDLQLIKASLLLSEGQYDEAKVLGKKLASLNGDNPDVQSLNLMLAKATGDAAEKKEVIQNLLKKDPYNSAANVELGEEQVLLHNYKLAKKYYKQSLVKDPENIEGLFGYGQMSYYEDKLDDAKVAFEHILKIDANNSSALAYLGKLAAEKENYLQAAKYIKKAIKNDPNNYNYYIDLGTYMRHQGKFDEAEQAWTKAINLRPDYFLAYTDRAGLYDEQNKYDKALADYLMVVKTNPKYYFAFESLGILAWHEKKYEAAIDGFSKAYKINNDNNSYALMAAAAYYKLNKKAEAKEILTEAMKNKDKQSLSYGMLRLYYDMGGTNAESNITLKVQNEKDRTKKGKMLYYLALYWELKGNTSLALKYYTIVAATECPMFFEYRLAEWAVKN